MHAIIICTAQNCLPSPWSQYTALHYQCTESQSADGFPCFQSTGKSSSSQDNHVNNGQATSHDTEQEDSGGSKESGITRLLGKAAALFP